MRRALFFTILILVLLLIIIYNIHLFMNMNKESKESVIISYSSESKVSFKQLEKLTNNRFEMKNEEKFQAGMNILIYGSPDLSIAKVKFERLKDLGVNSIALNFPLFQSDWKSNQVEIAPSMTPPLSDLEELIKLAHSNHFDVMIRPIIDEQTLINTGHWRGEIQPEDPQLWFNRYQEILLTYAALAEKHHVKYFNIGTELNALQNDYGEKWIKLIEEIREVYNGKILYSFNWNIVNQIPNIEFVSSLDYVGIDAYFPLDAPDGASVEKLEKKWGKWVNEVNHLIEEEKLIITEAGVVPVEGAYRTPYEWNYVNKTIDVEAQVNYYIATYNSWKPIINGIYWWTVTIENENIDLDYSPLGLPTEEIIKKQFKLSQSN